MRQCDSTVRQHDGKVREILMNVATIQVYPVFLYFTRQLTDSNSSSICLCMPIIRDFLYLESTREELKVSCDPKEDPVAENKREGVTTDMEEEEEEEEEAGVVKNKGSSNKKKRNRNRQHRKKSASSLTDLNLRVMSK